MSAVGGPAGAASALRAGPTVVATSAGLLSDGAAGLSATGALATAGVAGSAGFASAGLGLADATGSTAFGQPPAGGATTASICVCAITR